MINSATNLRALCVLEARRSGQTLRQIAEKIWFLDRACPRQLGERGLQVEHELTSANVWFELSARVRNALVNDGCEPTPDGVVEHFKVRDVKRSPFQFVSQHRRHALHEFCPKHGAQDAHI